MSRERLEIELDNAPQHGEDEQVHIARYRFATHYVHGKRTLDVACGVGYGSCLLARAGASQVTGVHISEEAIGFARRQYSGENLAYRVGSAYDLSAFRGVDFVVSFETIEHVDKPRLFLDQIVAALKDDGVLVVSTPNRVGGCLSDKPSNPFHVREWSDREFLGLVSAYFEDVALFGQRFAFAPLGFPGSRTLARALASVLAPGLTRIDSRVDPVVYPTRAWFRFHPAFTIAVCRRPVR